MKNKKEPHLFYLKMNKELDSSFIRLATEFSDSGVKLIPIGLSDYLALQNSKLHFLLIDVRDVEDHHFLTRCRPMGLDFSVRRNKTHLFHLTSFGKLHFSNVSRAVKNYQHIALPIRSKYLVEEVCEVVKRKDTDVFKWPGGRKSALPKL